MGHPYTSSGTEVDYMFIVTFHDEFPETGLWVGEVDIFDSQGSTNNKQQVVGHKKAFQVRNSNLD